MKISCSAIAGVVRNCGLAATLGMSLLLAGCGDVFRPVATPITGPPGDPNLFHLEFVVSQNAPLNGGSAQQIDVSGDTNAAVITTGTGSVHAALLPPSTTRLMVANRDNDTITTFLPGFTSSIPPITIQLPPGSKPVFLATTEETKMYVANSGTNSVGVIAAAQSTFQQGIPVGTNPVALAETANGKKLYCANQGDNTVSIIDTNAKSLIGTIPVGASPVWLQMSPDQLSLYVLNQGSNNISVVDVTTDTVIATIPVGTSPDHMFLDLRLSRLYVANTGSDNVSILDASVTPPVPITTVAVSAGVVAVTALPNGTQAYAVSVQVAASVTTTLTAINTQNNAVSKTKVVADVPAACDSTVRFRSFVAASGDGTRVYVSNCDAGATSFLRASDASTIVAMPSPPSAFPPPGPGGQPPPQRPVFIVAGP
jgi:YVTN family beta-propeller protein